jgi:hypothetical protein
MRRRVLFFSNYDGSLVSYMDDFVNKVAWGLNAVFSNGITTRTRVAGSGWGYDEQQFRPFTQASDPYAGLVLGAQSLHRRQPDQQR